jgi:hypothetical protein
MYNVRSDSDGDSSSSSSSSNSSILILSHNLTTSEMEILATKLTILPETVSFYDDNDVKIMYFYYDSLSEVLENVVDDANVTSLRVESITLFPSMMNSLIRVVEENKRIRSISVIDVEFYNGDLERFLDAMKGNSYVERFEMSSIIFMDDKSIEYGSMLRMLSENKTILELRMNFCIMGVAILEAFSQGMMVNDTIKKLSVEDCKGWNEGGDVFDTMAVVLDTNSTLEEVRMGGNNCCKMSIEALLDSLCRSRSVRHLGLERLLTVRRGEVSWKWMSSLVAKTLACNTSLNHLDITNLLLNDPFAIHPDEIVIMQALVDHPRDQTFALGMYYDEDKIQSWLEKAVEFPHNGDNVMDCIANDWDQKARRLVLQDGLHPILGKGSIVQMLDIDLVNKICAFQIC